MTRLDRITMQNFKSFSGKVTIPFPEGFNVVCGPNGSGKSNIVDALTFVLGASSARTIRAQKLQNLIFNGGKERKPADFCEVSLYLNNDDKRMPYGEEVKITRKITRSGISVYRIDGRTVNKSKVMDLISNINLSQEGYNIIMQGDVTKIIEMSSKERRGIIDDISGITEFDEKKDKANRELERVENRVRENMIIVAEKQNLVSRLKEERENAIKYQKLEKELRKSKASMVKKKIKDVNDKITAIDKDVKDGSKKLEEIDKNFDAIEKNLEKKESGMKEITDKIIDRSKNLDVIRKIDSIKTDIVRKKDRIDFNEREIMTLDEKSDVVKKVVALGFSGVYGTVKSLVDAESRYSIAIDVAMGMHKNDIVVSDDDTAVKCIKYLKENRIGRSRFLPLNRLKYVKRKKCDDNIIGFAIDLIDFDRKYQEAMEFVFGNTLVVNNIDEAKKIKDFRVVTLDGDLIDARGSMTGGFYKRVSRNVNIQKLKKENELLVKEIEGLEKELKKMEKEVVDIDVDKIRNERGEQESGISELRKERNKIFDEKSVLQNSINKIKIERAKAEANLENLKIDEKEFSDVKEFYNLSLDELQERVTRAASEIHKLGPVNLKAIEEYSMINVEFEELKKKLDKLLEEKEAVSNAVSEIEKKRYGKFMETFNGIRKNFSDIYGDMERGIGNLRLEEEGNIESGLVIEASPAGKKVLNMDSMSGGEKTVTSLAFLFSIMKYYSSPFYVLDEIDAALDKVNTRKIADLVKLYSKDVQFIVITHNDIMIQYGDKIFGVSIDSGVSKIFGIELPDE